jgi:protein TonB
MELKKNPRADLRRYAGLFFEAGLVVALSAVLASFNYTNHELNRMVFSGIDNIDFEDVLIPVTHPKEIAPPPAPPKVAEVITIIESESELEETLDIDDVEATQETAITIIERPDEAEEAEPEIFFSAEVNPSFPGGMAALYKLIGERLNYPEAARSNGITGKVHLKFVINKKGEVENVQITRGVDPLLDREAIRVIEGLPRWNPGTQRGKPVNVWFSMPINFQLN